MYCTAQTVHASNPWQAQQRLLNCGLHPAQHRTAPWSGQTDEAHQQNPQRCQAHRGCCDSCQEPPHACCCIHLFLLGLPLHTQPTALQHRRPQPQAATSLLRKVRRHISAYDFIQPANVQVQRAHSPPGHYAEKNSACNFQIKSIPSAGTTCTHSCTCMNSQHPRTTSTGGSEHSLVHHPRQPHIPLFQPGWVETRAKLSKHTGCTWGLRPAALRCPPQAALQPPDLAA